MFFYVLKYLYLILFQAEEKYKQKKCYPAIKRTNSNNINDVTIIKVNDCVLFTTNNGEPAFVGKISSIWMDEKKCLRLSLFRFYRSVNYYIIYKTEFKSFRH